MVHLSENSQRLSIRRFVVRHREDLLTFTEGFGGVCLVKLPSCPPGGHGHRLRGIGEILSKVTVGLGPQAVMVTVGEPVDLVAVHAAVARCLQYQHWMAVKRTVPRADGLRSLPTHHFGALVHTAYDSPLRHARTRIRYTYCPACGRTTKDYGGKKHLYHKYGTLMSDVWRDIACDPDGDLTPVVERFADLFGIEPYRELRVLDLRLPEPERTPIGPSGGAADGRPAPSMPTNVLIRGDCLEELRKIPDDSVDFAFADPPYNLRKRYTGYGDSLEIDEYLTWCDRWLTELARVLRPGRTCAVLNIPLWAIRHFLHLETVLHFQNWIVWDALAFPVRLIMPAHYTILCFSKGPPRELPGLSGGGGRTEAAGVPPTFRALEPLAEGFCLRTRCVKARREAQTNDRGPLTDLWWDIHRLKHNSRRADHPCQLPPHLMYRLISVFTKPGEVVLDCFNGVGTTTLAAQMLGRRYVGIEISEKYHRLAEARHEELGRGANPFRKTKRIPADKNSPVPRMPRRRYEVPKKTLQLEVKRIAERLGRLPTREEVARYGRYPIRLYDEYFVSWGEACAAARTTGMSEFWEELPGETEPPT
ncbi:MAG TPA: site-specific DNA-methyltransferase [Anaerolineae bacterium]|nr:site-specific DNA-methyltransferase [Anaerolineae bacterium]